MPPASLNIAVYKSPTEITSALARAHNESQLHCATNVRIIYLQLLIKENDYKVMCITIKKGFARILWKP